MSLIEVQKKGSYLEVSLARPQSRNAFNADLISEIKETFQSVSKDPDCRVVLLKGQGESFCAGADLEYMKSMAGFSEAENKEDANQLFDMFLSIRNCALPVVTLVHGHAMGGGVGIVAASDIVIAEESTKFAFSEVKLGLVPAVISSFVLEKIIVSRARELMLTGRVFTGVEALEIGLVGYTARGAEAEELALSIVNDFDRLGPEAVRETKKLLLSYDSDFHERARQTSVDVISKRRVSVEGQEGIKAFLEKRKPSWWAERGDTH